MEQINFANGQPSDLLLPQELMLEAASSVLQGQSQREWPSSQPLNYGDNPATFRNSLAHFLSNSALCGEGKETVNPSLLVPTTGVSHGLDMICTMMCKKHNVQRGTSHFVFVEDCTYYLSSSVFKDYGLQVRSVKTDSEGIVVQDLLHQLEECKSGGENELKPLFLYTIPLFNNPTGRCISAARKKELLSATILHNLLVVSDEVYQMLDGSNHLSNLSATRLPPLQSLLSMINVPELKAENNFSEPTNILVVSSFSKILAPGLRVGWIRCSTLTQAQDLWDLGLMRSGSSTCHFTSCLVAHLLQPLSAPDEPYTCLLESQISTLCGIYAKKYEILTSALLEYSKLLLQGDAGGSLHIDGFTENAELSGKRPRVGGYFVWVRLPSWCGTPGSDTAHPFSEAVRSYGLIVRAGVECTGNSEGNKNFIRLCFARLSENELREGARRLCQALADVYRRYNEKQF